ncbi:MAG: hypothetical protein ACE5O2_12550, partial [Armatimonadota bacterium]
MKSQTVAATIVAALLLIIVHPPVGAVGPPIPWQSILVQAQEEEPKADDQPAEDAQKEPEQAKKAEKSEEADTEEPEESAKKGEPDESVEPLPRNQINTRPQIVPQRGPRFRPVPVRP